MAGNTPISTTMIPKKSQEGLLQFHNQCFQMFNQQWNIRDQMRAMDLQYIREADWTKENLRAKAANRYGDKDRFQNVTIPVVLPQVESAVTYQTSVFLSGTPLFGVVADPQFADEALQLETLIDQQAIRGGWAREFELFFRDGFKYNLSAIEVDWARETTVVLETDLSFSTKEAKPKNVIWEGNRIRRWDMYNTFFDTRVHPTEMHTKGEFIGRTEILSRIMLKQFINTLPDVRLENITAAFESGAASVSYDNAGSAQNYYIPRINPRAVIDYQLLSGGFNWLAWAEMAGSEGKIQYKNLYEVTTIYARILPGDFGIKVPGQNTPQVWKLIFINHQVLIYAERLTNAHGYLPVFMGQPLEDGLGYQTKSLAENVSPIQDITSALSNANIAARRRAISDRTLYDPSRISEAHINSANPAAKIPVRPAAYGKPVGESVYAFPFRDDQSQHVMAQIQTYGSLANVISGQNPVRQGQFVKGNKTRGEFNDVMANANGRDQTTAIKYEAQIFTPIKEVLKINTLQYQGAGTFAYSRDQQKQVPIDPVALRKSVLQFKLSDGLLPSEKIMDGEAWSVSMQVIGSTPQIAAGFNIGPMFSYLMKMRGADLTPFQKSPQQQAYEQAMGSWQQAVVAMAKENKDIKPEQYPPQPTPEQFGYDPQAAAKGAPQAAAPAAPQQ